MYTLIETMVKDESGHDVKTYGIRYGEQIINDISIDKETVQGLADKCNRHKLSPLHLKEVIEDFLNC